MSIEGEWIRTEYATFKAVDAECVDVADDWDEPLVDDVPLRLAVQVCLRSGNVRRTSSHDTRTEADLARNALVAEIKQVNARYANIRQAWLRETLG